MPRISEWDVFDRNIPKRYLDKRTDKHGNIYYVVPKEILAKSHTEHELIDTKIKCARAKGAVAGHKSRMEHQTFMVKTQLEGAIKSLEGFKALIADQKQNEKDKKELCGKVLPLKKKLRKEMKADIKKNKRK